MTDYSLMSYVIGFGTIAGLVGLIVVYHLVFDRPSRAAAPPPDANRPKTA